MKTGIPAGLILSTLDRLDGDLIHPVSGFLDAGYPAEFVEPLAETFVDEPDNPFGRLRTADGKGLEHMRGVHDLDLLGALARFVDADTSGVGAYGHGKRARQYKAAIRVALGRPPGEWGIEQTPRRRKRKGE